MMFALTVSLTIHGFWVTRLMLPLITTLGLYFVALNFIYPNSEYINEDFPEPISPMIATIYPFFMVKLRSVKCVELSVIDKLLVYDLSQ